ncbi:MAG: HDOD domain-containing protein [Fibrobacter sp.]|nr:HDOD domain-containing protein [Fibrobacter sp.]
MKKKIIPGVFGGGNSGPLLLIFSPRERVRDILTVGLIQCNYQVIQANSSSQATIKASQMLPKLVIADLSCDNPKDILIAERLQKSQRTRHISTLLITTKVPNPLVQKVTAEMLDQIRDADHGKLSTMGYPFAFSEFLAKIESLVLKTEPASDKNPPNDQNRIIAEHLFDPSIPVDRKMQNIGKSLHKNWGFPFTVVKAMDIIESDVGCTLELSKCISTDPAVSSTILKIANTVQYARRHGRITDIKEAVVRLGFRETRSIMACMSLIDLSPEVYRNRGFGRREFWLHSLTVGLIAEKICIDCYMQRPELAFIAGLLHDFGKIPLDNDFDSVFPRLLDRTMGDVCAFYEAEDVLMGFTHADLGYYLTSNWNFPPSVTMAIMNHHDPERILKITSANDKIIQEAVYVGNLLAKALGLGHSCDEILEEIPAEMLKDLQMGSGPDDKLFSHIIKQLRILCSYLNLQLRELKNEEQKPDGNESDVVVVYNDRAIYHPMIVALRNNGFNVVVTNQIPGDTPGHKRVVISIPEPGAPLDINIYGDEREVNRGETLKIFLVNMEHYRELRHGITDANLILMDRRTFDVRLLLHTLDIFFERITLPTNAIQ